MRTWISLLVLAAAVAALSVFVYRKESAPEERAHALSELKAAHVKRVRLEWPPAPQGTEAPNKGASPAQTTPSSRTVQLERRDETWRMTAPFDARADTARIDRLLAILDARSVARYPATNLSRYGLEPPAMTLFLNDESFGFGGINTITQEQYVLARNGVYAIPLAQRVGMPRDAEPLLAHTLFATEEKPVRFELETFTASLNDGKWAFAPVTEDPGPDERNGWVAAWRQATASRVTPHDGRKPLANVTIGLEGGRVLTLGILQREPELVLLRTDEKLEYHFGADTAKRLLSPPTPKP